MEINFLILIIDVILIIGISAYLAKEPKKDFKLVSLAAFVVPFVIFVVRLVIFSDIIPDRLGKELLTLFFGITIGWGLGIVTLPIAVSAKKKS